MRERVADFRNGDKKSLRNLMRREMDYIVKYGGSVKEGISRLRRVEEEELVMATSKYHVIDSIGCVVD